MKFAARSNLPNNDYNRFDLKGTLWWLLRFTVCLGLIFFGLAACNTISTAPQGPPQSLYDKSGVFPAYRGVPMPPMPSLSVRMASVVPNPTNGTVICLTNAAGRVKCFTVQSNRPYTGLFLLFPCVTSPSNHSVVQSSPDLKTWLDLPASAFGYSNYTSQWTYMYGSTNQHIGLIVTNGSPARFYRVAWRD